MLSFDKEQLAAAMFRLHFPVHAAREGHYTSLLAEGAVVKLTDTDWLNWSTPGSTAAHNPDANPLLIESRHVACLASPEDDKDPSSCYCDLQIAHAL